MHLWLHPILPSLFVYADPPPLPPRRFTSQKHLNFPPPPLSCYHLSHKIYLRLILLSLCLRASDCVILRMSRRLKVRMEMCVSMITSEDASECVCVCVQRGLVWCVLDRGNWAQRVFCLWWQRGNWNLQNPLERPSHMLCVVCVFCCVCMHACVCGSCLHCLSSGGETRRHMCWD